ncbi:unnamed protein product [Blepharisma stoltei]|uniref:Uncharacterized protein n=1 Tax=Blepharisma stoltei TaxID=1481888 RepID=A0AAU9J1Z7_9CILI|nr:unnamed protein product [Blepharisma stoltei]
MDLPVTLESLNVFHQKAMEEDEIQSFQEDLASMIKDSKQKGHFKGLRSESEYLQSLNTKKINSLLPNNLFKRKLDIFETFVKHFDLNNLDVNIPTTLMRTENLPVCFLIRTIKNGKVASRPCYENEFFEMENEGCKETNAGTPLYAYKTPNKEVSVICSIEHAQNIWRSSKEPARLQKFVKSLSNPPSITRVLWVEGSKNKYFSIINNKKLKWDIKNDSKLGPNRQQGVRKRTLSNFEYRKMLKQTSQSINNPFKIKTIEKKGKNRIPSLSQSFCQIPTDDTIFPAQEPKSEASKRLREDSYADFLVDSKKIEKCCVVESRGKYEEICSMVSQIIDFLNKQVFKEDNVKGIVLDFILNNERKWVLLKCKEFSNSYNKSLQTSCALNNGWEKKRYIRKERSQSNDFSRDLKLKTLKLETSEVEPSIKNEETQSTLAESYKAKPRHRLTPIDLSEKDIFERCSKVNERIDKIVSHQSEINLSSHFTEPQSNPAYEARISPQSCSIWNPSISKFKCPFYKKATIESSNSSNNSEGSFNEKVDAYTRNHINNMIDSLDELNLNAQIAKVKNEKLVEKYGGDAFWNKFILSLYNKILANELLSKYFKSSKLENFAMIVDGMFELFNGNVTLAFRRKVRASHQFMGLVEKEFNFYVDIFEDTLNEFQVTDIDKNIVMTQIRSMKCLICRQSS